MLNQVVLVGTVVTYSDKNEDISILIETKKGMVEVFFENELWEQVREHMLMHTVVGIKGYVSYGNDTRIIADKLSMISTSSNNEQEDLVN